ncbi:beta-lactamase/transpeptidase-like protein [Podospora aff. communis PSN243]|uniref:Beta-lactamase/transpeptidase-like protein n=1 Tax=Podospora aff. communis PSN243 TaxID=3040156 RepID=A0AAV9GGC4_9PEZI|nr:beta-lactamase/transpeptidase-like protein [Podospora aff. communis PSN243]
MPSSLFLAAALGLAALPFSAANVCPPLGPVLLAPRSPSQNPIVKAAIGSLEATLDGQLKGQVKGSAVSLAAKSIHEDGLLFNYHFTPPTQSGLGTTNVDENTIYRVGSVSKLMPVLALLQDSNVSLEDPVTKYLPALKDAKGSSEVLSVSWDDITIGSLMSHLSGLATDSAQDLAVYPTGPWTAMGLPQVAKGTGPACSGLPGTKLCNATDLIRDMARRPPVYREFTTPVYSNVGYALLGLVVEAATNQTFKEAVQKSIFDVVGMTSTSFDGFPASFPEKGFIPVKEGTWNLTLGAFESSGGMFSSTNDLISFGNAILTHRLLSAPKTRKWLQPAAHTASPSFSVGGPWEIARSHTLTHDNRTIDVYAKTGDLGQYHAILALIPDYDLVFTIITAGPEATVNPNLRTILLSTALRTLLPAIDQSARDEASSHGYTGTFTSSSTNSSLTLTLPSDSSPGLLLSSLTVRGFNALAHFPSYSLASLEAGSITASTNPVSARLYPSNRQGENGTETAWRAVIDTATEEQKKTVEEQIFYEDASCVTWFGMDRAAYNHLSLSDFVFVTDDEGTVVEVKSPAFDVTFVRTGDAPVVERGSGGGTGTGRASESGAGGLGRSGVFGWVVVMAMAMLML